jgi:hypothetical protein
MKVSARFAKSGSPCPMTRRNRKTRIFRAVAMASLAIYGGIAALGHGLHAVMPCGDQACIAQRSETDEGCCCHHHTCHAEQSHSHSDSRLAFRAPGHDPDECSVCALLAQMKVGRASVFDLAIHFESARFERPLATGLLASDLILSKTSRGPPCS